MGNPITEAEKQEIIETLKARFDAMLSDFPVRKLQDTNHIIAEAAYINCQMYKALKVSPNATIEIKQPNKYTRAFEHSANMNGVRNHVEAFLYRLIDEINVGTTMFAYGVGQLRAKMMNEPQFRQENYLKSNKAANTATTMCRYLLRVFEDEAYVTLGTKKRENLTTDNDFQIHGP